MVLFREPHGPFHVLCVFLTPTSGTVDMCLSHNGLSGFFKHVDGHLDFALMEPSFLGKLFRLPFYGSLENCFEFKNINPSLVSFPIPCSLVDTLEI